MLSPIIQLVLVAFPSLWGMSQGEKSRTLPPLFRTLISVAAACALLALLFQEPEIRFFVANRYAGKYTAPIRLLHPFVYWRLHTSS
jgi:hypothetical protein